MRVRGLISQLSATEWLIIVYALLNAVLYASLVPLWEGFDEPFHYGIVRDYGRLSGFPVMGKATLDGEVAASLKQAPLSYLLKRNLGGGITFDEYFRLSVEERAAMRARLRSLRQDLLGEGGNYEAQQAPLAYVVMAAVDRLSGDAPLPDRVFRLRLFAALLAAAAAAAGLIWLTRILNLPAPAALCALFVAMSGQMFFATTAHVANDWLAVSLFVLLAASGASVIEKPTLRRGLATSALLAAALLTKASMLAAAPWAVLVVLVKLKWKQGAIALLPLLAAVPWYIRNVVVYGNLSGMHEFASRGGGTTPLAAAPLVPWFEAAWHMARSAVWTGNNSFTPMSRDIVAFFLLLGVVGFLSALLQDWQQRLPRTEGLVWPLAGLMVASLGYAITVSFWFTQGTSFSAGAWYAQPLALLVSVLFCGAFSRARGLGRVSMMAAALVSAYLLALTWWVKLMPLYAGLQSGRNTFDGTVALYRDRGAELASRLSETAMIPAVPIFVMAAASTVLGVALAARIVWMNRRA